MQDGERCENVTLGDETAGYAKCGFNESFCQVNKVYTVQFALGKESIFVLDLQCRIID